MEAVKQIEKSLFKPALVQVQSGDTVRVHQLIREGAKQRVQIFEGVVIRTVRPGELTAAVTVRRLASGVGVEKTFLMHSPNVQKIEVLRRSRVRRNFLSYLRGRRGKAARLQEVSFDKSAANAANLVKAEVVEEVASDAEITEIDAEMSREPEVDVSTEELAKEENREAGEAEPQADANAESDEQLLAAEETESGVNKAQPEA